MGDVRTIRRLVAYNRTVFDRFERAVARRGWREAAANREIGHHSLKNTLVHILNVHEAWLVAVAQGKWEVFDAPDRQPEDVRSIRDLRRYRARVWDGGAVLIAGLTDTKLRARVQAPWMPGRFTLEDAFYQVSFEQAHHLGEIIGALWQSNWRPPEMTWIRNQP